MIFSLLASMRIMPASASSALCHCSIIAIAASFAPPCKGPRSVPIAPVTQE
ncbi:Uncharacterised protein [Vibrio cholerae]|nr:Uncharacterised protein [Vibrio cholerae]CSI70747.1 Uncharacterised protein [Vibrio cholerae]